MAKDLQPRRESLFDIEAAWMPLLEARIEAETSPELSDDREACPICEGMGVTQIRPFDPEAAEGCTAIPCPACEGIGTQASERERAIEAADVALADHAQKEIQKADSYIRLIRFLKFTVAARKEEAERQSLTAGILERILDQVKATGLYAMESLGRKRIEGSIGYLLAKANGGVAPLLISDPDLVPSELTRLEGWVLESDWKTMIEATRKRHFNKDWCPRADLKRRPDNTLIRAKLAEPCQTCGGRGSFQIPDGQPPEAIEPTCETCGGSGKNAVPGAALGERGNHLECR